MVINLTRALVAAFGLTLAVSAAQAQQPQTTRYRGTLDALNGDTLTMTTKEGQKVDIGLTPETGISGMVGLTMADIKQGDFVGAAAVPGEGNQLIALEVHRFPAGSTARQGHTPFDLVPDSSMTNAILAEVQTVEGGQVIKLDYEGGSQELLVAPDTPVVTWEPGDRALLVPGAAVLVIAQKADDGTSKATQVRAEKNGVKPPM